MMRHVHEWLTCRGCGEEFCLLCAAQIYSAFTLQRMREAVSCPACMPCDAAAREPSTGRWR